MTLTELRYIVTLSQEQHFGRAAERCFVAQPIGLSCRTRLFAELMQVQLRTALAIRASDLFRISCFVLRDFDFLRPRVIPQPPRRLDRRRRRAWPTPVSVHDA